MVIAQDGVTIQTYTVALTLLLVSPTATTLPATGVTGTAVTLNGTVNPNGDLRQRLV